MEKIICSSEYFSAEDTLCCGQVFRFSPADGGYIVFSGDKACRVATRGDKTVIISEDAEYFANYFDLGGDYEGIVRAAKKSGNPFLTGAAERGRGIRILRQDVEETLFSFVISQNNNIPRIKGIIERLSRALGKEKKFGDTTYYSFPKAADIAKESPVFYREAGLGYRADYLPAVADAISGGFDLNAAATLSTPDLKKELVKLKGVGPKVADCVLLFGFHRSDSFPVDTWMEKIYREDFGGTLSSRDKITEFFMREYGDNAGYFQQYMFHYKRNGKKPE